MNETIRYVGLDIHKSTMTIAVAEGSGDDAKVWGQIDSDQVAIEGIASIPQGSTGDGSDAGGRDRGRPPL